MAKNKPRFIRRKGKIIPIGVKKKKKSKGKEIAKGAAISAAGVATAFGAGKITGKALKKAERTSQIAFRFASEKSDFLPKRFKGSASRAFGSAGRGLKLSKSFSAGGQVLGGALISKGVRDVLKQFGIKSDSIESSIAAEAGSQTAAAIISRQVKKKLKVTSRIRIPTGVKDLGKSLAARFFLKRQLRFRF